MWTKLLQFIACVLSVAPDIHQNSNSFQIKIRGIRLTFEQFVPIFVYSTGE